MKDLFLLHLVLVFKNKVLKAVLYFITLEILIFKFIAKIHILTKIVSEERSPVSNIVFVT